MTKVNPRLVFQERCEARAKLYQAGEYTLHEAVDKLQLDAVATGLVADIGQDTAQAIISAAFTVGRDKVPDALPDEEPISVAQSTLDTAAWLWFQAGDVGRFRSWLNRHSQAEAKEIMQHIKNIKAKRNARNQR